MFVPASDTNLWFLLILILVRKFEKCDILILDVVARPQVAHASLCVFPKVVMLRENLTNTI